MKKCPEVFSRGNNRVIINPERTYTFAAAMPSGVKARETPRYGDQRKKPTSIRHRKADHSAGMIFQFRTMKNHEVHFYFRMKTPKSGLPDGIQGDHKAEKLLRLLIEKLKNDCLAPEFLKKLFTERPESVQHFVTNEY